MGSMSVGEETHRSDRPLLSRPASQSTTDADRSTWRSIYAAHFLRTWGERAWEFAVGLILLSLNPDTLWLVALYGLVENVAVILFVPGVGEWLDRQRSHLRGALLMFQCQNLGNILSSGLAFVMLSGYGKSLGPGGRYAIIGCMVLASCMARVASAGASLSVERKWVKVLCKDEGNQRMAIVNSAMRRIDLICLLAAPMFAGFCMTFLSLPLASLALATYNLATWAPSVVLLKCAASWSSRRRFLDGALFIEEEGEEQTAGREPLIGEAPVLTDIAQRPPGAFHHEQGQRCHGACSVLRRATDHSRLYCAQPVALAGIALAMLYFSVLSLGLIMTSFLKWQGISEATLSLFRGFGAAVSVSATYSFPSLNKLSGARTTGLLGIGTQLLCLAATTSLLFLIRSSAMDTGGHDGLLYAMLICLLLSRWGLWTFDLAVTQQMQELVDDDALGVVNGVQGSLQSSFEMAMACVTVAVPNPRNFVYLAVASSSQVMLATLVYIAHIVASRRRTLAAQLPEPAS